MYRNPVRRRAVDSTEADTTSEAWVFAQQLLGNPIPDPRAATARARHDRELLEFAASISDRAPDELLRLQAAESKARRDRELLEWLAPMSDEHQRELRALQAREARERESRRRLERFVRHDPFLTEWNEADHPRAAKGTPIGGQWIEKGGGGTTGATPTTPIASAFDVDSEDDEEFEERIPTRGANVSNKSSLPQHRQGKFPRGSFSLVYSVDPVFPRKGPHQGKLSISGLDGSSVAPSLPPRGYDQANSIAKAAQDAAGRVDKAADLLANYTLGVSRFYKDVTTPNQRLADSANHRRALDLISAVKREFDNGRIRVVVNYQQKDGTSGDVTDAYVNFFPFTNIVSEPTIFVNPSFFATPRESPDVIFLHEVGRLINWLGETSTNTWKDAYVFRNMVISLSDHYDEIRTLNTP